MQRSAGLRQLLLDEHRERPELELQHAAPLRAVRVPSEYRPSTEGKARPVMALRPDALSFFRKSNAHRRRARRKRRRNRLTQQTSKHRSIATAQAVRRTRHRQCGAPEACSMSSRRKPRRTRRICAQWRTLLRTNTVPRECPVSTSARSGARRAPLRTASTASRRGPSGSGCGDHGRLAETAAHPDGRAGLIARARQRV